MQTLSSQEIKLLEHIIHTKPQAQNVQWLLQLLCKGFSQGEV